MPPGPRYAYATLDDYLPLDTAVDRLPGGAQVVGVSAMLAEGVLRDRMVAPWSGPTAYPSSAAFSVTPMPWRNWSWTAPQPLANPVRESLSVARG